MTLYAIFYYISNDCDWRYYGAFTSMEMAKDMQKHLWKRISDRGRKTVATKIVEFDEGKLVQEAEV